MSALSKGGISRSLATSSANTRPSTAADSAQSAAFSGWQCRSTISSASTTGTIRAPPPRRILPLTRRYTLPGARVSRPPFCSRDGRTPQLRPEPGFKLSSPAPPAIGNRDNLSSGAAPTTSGTRHIPLRRGALRRAREVLNIFVLIVPIWFSTRLWWPSTLALVSQVAPCTRSSAAMSMSSKARFDAIFMGASEWVRKCARGQSGRPARHEHVYILAGWWRVCQGVCKNGDLLRRPHLRSSSAARTARNPKEMRKSRDNRFLFAKFVQRSRSCFSRRTATT